MEPHSDPNAGQSAYPSGHSRGDPSGDPGSDPATDPNRRPIAARGAAWAPIAARRLARAGATPNQVSVASIGFAALGTAALLTWPGPLGYVLAAVGIQLRLLCNLLDGMLAIEGGLKTPTGALYNEFPDRIADSLLLVALGYAAYLPWLGWLGALLAALTAYVRLSGGALGLAQDFRGPMAKQHRMAVMTVGLLLAAVESAAWHTTYALQAAAWIIAVGAALTCVTRTRAIAAQLRAAA